MNKPILLLFFILCSFKLFAFGEPDTLKQGTPVGIYDIDSLKQQLELTTNDSLKAPLYTQIAQQYLRADTISNKRTRLNYQNAAISNTLSALHIYSRYNDTTGLRISFDDLAKAYHAERKYPQAKWFILQSNTLSRAKKDNLNIIASLLELASIKADIKDYKLAARDLNEALCISSKNHYPQLESQVQLSYAMFYDKMKNYGKADLALKRAHAIDDSIKRSEEAKLTAAIVSKDSLLQVKKKLYTMNSRKFSKNNSSKRTALL